MKYESSAPNIPYSSLHVWIMSFICLLLLVMAAAAATRLPHYLATADTMRFIGTVLFNILALVGVADNIHTHYLVWQRQNHSEVTQLATQN